MKTLCRKTRTCRVAVFTTLVAFAVPTLASDFLGESFDCETASEDLSRAFELHPAPTDAGVVPQMQHLMWMLESAIDLLDSDCSYLDNYAAIRAEYARSLSSTEAACNAIAANGPCTAQRWN